MNVALKNLGCVKNQVDAEYLLGELKHAEHNIINEFNQAECIIVNTCGFIESAKQESIQEIFDLLENKINGKCKIFIVTGCLAQRYVDELAEEIPEIDAVVGVGAINEIREMLNKEEILHKKFISNKDGYFLNTAEMPRHSLTNSHNTYLKIADGCDNRCTYCAIPNIRGPYRSRSLDDLVAEARTIVARGVKEINVIAQDTTSYGKDINDSQGLTELLQQITQIEGDYWIRVLYCYPEYIDDKLLNFIASSPKMCKYIDMPIQHVHPEIVKKMRRKLDGEQILALISKMRNIIPDLVIRSTFLVGFPGEKAEHFKYLTQFVKQAQLDWAGVFAYSREENTPAYKLPGHVAEKTKSNRQLLLTELQNKISANRFQKYIGKNLKVLVDGRSELNEDAYEGRTMFHAPEVDGVVYFTTTSTIAAGDFVDISITHTDGLDLIGEKKA